MQKILIPSLVLLGTFLSAQEPSQNPLIEVPGTNLQIRQWQEAGVPKSALSRDGGETWTGQQQIDTLVHIRYGDIDPLVPPAVPASLRAAADSRLFIVQFKTQIEPEFRYILQYLGAEVTYYLPSQSYLVRMDPGLDLKVQNLSFVRAVTPYHAAYRLEPEIVHGLAQSRGAKTRYVIVLVDKHRDAAGVEGAVLAMDGQLNLRAEGGILLEATLDEEQLLTLAKDDRILWIERSTEPEVDIDNARIQGGANYLGTVAAIDGKGISGHIMEGVYGSHPELAAIPPYRTAASWVADGAASSHGTNTAGEIYAKGNSALYKGLLPFAKCYYTNYNYVYNKSTRYPLTKDLVDPTKFYKCMIQTASWGYTQTTVYTAHSMEMDDIIFDFDFFVTQSQSNLGASSQPRNSRPQAWAKNICSVGGFYHLDNSNAADDYWGKSGSTGPAADGRIGVTLAAYYDKIGTISGTTGYTTGFGGTSGATPIINGYGGLMIQMFTEGMFGYPAAPTWNVRFDYKPHFSTTKALLVATAKQLTYNSTGVTAGANRYQQGWGFPDLVMAWNERHRMLVIDELDVLQQGQARTYYLWVPQSTPTKEFNAALQYPDPEAAANATIHRINSVDLSVKFSDKKLYWGNNGLLTGQYSTTGGSANDRDTEECVIVANPVAGLCEVTVRATRVVQDGHVETKINDIDYGLVVRGVGGLRDTTGMALKLGSTGTGNLTVSLTNLPTGWTQGLTLFSLATKRPASTGNALGLEADGLTLSLLASPPAAGNVFHFVPTAAKLYPNVAHSFHPALALSLKGVTLDAVAVVFDKAGGIVGASNVSRITVP